MTDNKNTYINIYQLDKSEELIWHNCDSCGNMEDVMCEIVIGKGAYCKSLFVCNSCLARLIKVLLAFSKA